MVAGWKLVYPSRRGSPPDNNPSVAQQLDEDVWCAPQQQKQWKFAKPVTDDDAYVNVCTEDYLWYAFQSVWYTPLVAVIDDDVTFTPFTIGVEEEVWRAVTTRQWKFARPIAYDQISFGIPIPPVEPPTGQVGTPVVGGGIRRLPRFERERESEEEKLARRIREGTIQPEPVPAPPKDDSPYFQEAARLAKAIATARADAETSRQAIASYRQNEELLRQSAVVQGKLLRAEQALLLAQVTEAALMEEMEVIDIAYLAVAVLSMTLQ